MAKAKTIDGKDLMVTLGGKTIALATSCVINMNRAMNSAATKDDGAWDAPEPGDMSWDVSSDSLFAADVDDAANQLAFDALFDAWKNGSKLVVAFGVVSTPAQSLPAGGWVLGSGAYSGDAYVESVSINAAKGSSSTISVKLTGCGELDKVTA